MLFLFLAVVGGLLAGFALGGSLIRLEALTLRRVRLVAAAVVLQLAGTALFSGGWYTAALVASLALAVGFLAANPRLAGRGLIGAGLALNALVIGANGAMPVAVDAAASAGLSTGRLLDDPRHQIAGPHTTLAAFDDHVPLRLPLEPEVLSPGDIAVAAGAGLMVAQAMRRRMRDPAPIRVRPPATSGAGPPRPAGAPPPPAGAPPLPKRR